MIKYIAETKEYFDKRNGNSYWSCRVEDIENDRMYVFPFQYGYGDHSEDVVKKALNIDDWGKKWKLKNTNTRITRAVYGHFKKDNLKQKK